MVHIRTRFLALWNANAPLTAVSALMLAVFVCNVAGLILDRRVITGAPAWLKPAKFSLSTSIYSGTLAWVLAYVRRYGRQAQWAGAITAAALFVEIAIIDLQAVRGTTSHFNFQTPLDGVLFGIMGGSIFLLWAASIWITALLFRERFRDRGLGWAIRLGLCITVLGEASGGLMTRATPQQQALLARGQVSRIGAHTVGAPDGGEGLPGTNWSKHHGDLRIPHFLGLHGLQAIPLIYWFWLRRRRSAVKTVFIASGSYLSFASLLLVQALRGQSLVEPDRATVTSLGVWLAASIVTWACVSRFGSVRSAATVQAI